MFRWSSLTVILVSVVIVPSLMLVQPSINPFSTLEPTATTAPTATPTPVPATQRTVYLFLHEDVAQFEDGDCRISADRSRARLYVESDPRGHSIQRTLNEGGHPVDAEESPLNEPGCVFEFDLSFPEATGYTFRVTPTVLAEIPFGVIDESDAPLVLAMDQYGSRTPHLDGISVPTPEPTPTPLPPTPTPEPTPEPGKIDDDTYRIVGRFVLRSEDVVNTDTGCSGTGGFSDVSDGAQIIIRDGNNNILGVARLEDTDLSSTFGCSYIFTMDVPNASFYQVEFSHRSPLVYTFDEMEDMGWELWIGLGE